MLRHIKGYVDKGILSKEVFLLKVKFVDVIDKTSVGKINKVALREKHVTAI
jgi:fatty-acyl-CoA synthase